MDGEGLGLRACAREPLLRAVLLRGRRLWSPALRDLELSPLGAEPDLALGALLPPDRRGLLGGWRFHPAGGHRLEGLLLVVVRLVGALRRGAPLPLLLRLLRGRLGCLRHSPLLGLLRPALLLLLL